ncbi:MAG: hypothetical protein FWG73_01685 [Planctomycetaceae bacterium]|nr:hypothetical protein [Planctomycetaceae bacterium]
MMKPIDNGYIENRHVERILSLMVILYGLWFLIVPVEKMIWYASIFNLYSSPPMLPFSEIVAGCCLIIFFPYVVRGIAYCATKEKIREQRRWGACEIFALPLILFGLAMLLAHVCGLDMIIFGLRQSYFAGYGALSICFGLLLSVAVVVAFLCCTRLIAAWLLRKTA